MWGIAAALTLAVHPGRSTDGATDSTLMPAEKLIRAEPEADSRVRVQAWDALTLTSSRMSAPTPTPTPSPTLTPKSAPTPKPTGSVPMPKPMPSSPMPTFAGNSTVCEQWCAPRHTAPMMCGVLWFWHIEKTGGTTIRNYFKRADELGQLRDWKYVDMFEGRDAIRRKEGAENDGMNSVYWSDWEASEQWERAKHELSKPAPKLIVHAHHHMPGLANRQLMQKFATMRAELEQKGCGLRLATVLREPWSLQESLVSYKIYQQGKYGETENPRASTPEKAVEFLGGKHNAQCQYVMFGSQEQQPLRTNPASFLTCGAERFLGSVAKVILDDLDLVGATFKLDTFIGGINSILGLPLGQRPHAFHANPSPKPPWLGSLSGLAKAYRNADDQLYAAYCKPAGALCDDATPAPSSPWYTGSMTSRWAMMYNRYLKEKDEQASSICSAPLLIA